MGGWGQYTMEHFYMLALQTLRASIELFLMSISLHRLDTRKFEITLFLIPPALALRRNAGGRDRMGKFVPMTALLPCRSGSGHYQHETLFAEREDADAVMIGV